MDKYLIKDIIDLVNGGMFDGTVFEDATATAEAIAEDIDMEDGKTIGLLVEVAETVATYGSSAAIAMLKARLK